MKIISGNILDSKEDILVHQVNHKGVMGAGLALQIYMRYPGIITSYRAVCNQIPFEKVRKFGIVVWYTCPDEDREIASVFGQKNFGRGGAYTDYVSLKEGLTSVSRIAIREEKTIAIPYGIGCGLAGGDWGVVWNIILDVFWAIERNVFVYKLEN